MTTIFYEGDTLKAINVVDEDGSPCEGGLREGEMVRMIDRSSEFRRMICIERHSTGRRYQLDKGRFELHHRGLKGLTIEGKKALKAEQERLEDEQRNP